MLIFSKSQSLSSSRDSMSSTQNVKQTFCIRWFDEMFLCYDESRPQKKSSQVASQSIHSLSNRRRRCSLMSYTKRATSLTIPWTLSIDNNEHEEEVEDDEDDDYDDDDETRSKDCEINCETLQSAAPSSGEINVGENDTLSTSCSSTDSTEYPMILYHSSWIENQLMNPFNQLTSPTSISTPSFNSLENEGWTQSDIMSSPSTSTSSVKTLTIRRSLQLPAGVYTIHSRCVLPGLDAIGKWQPPKQLFASASRQIELVVSGSALNNSSLTPTVLNVTTGVLEIDCGQLPHSYDNNQEDEDLLNLKLTFVFKDIIFRASSSKEGPSCAFQLRSGRVRFQHCRFEGCNTAIEDLPPIIDSVSNQTIAESTGPIFLEIKESNFTNCLNAVLIESGCTRLVTIVRSQFRDCNSCLYTRKTSGGFLSCEISNPRGTSITLLDQGNLTFTVANNCLIIAENKLTGYENHEHIRIEPMSSTVHVLDNTGFK